MIETTNGFAHYWAEGDAISHSVPYLLAIMSLMSWYYILSKTWSAYRIRRSAVALEAFWKAPTLADAIFVIQRADTEDIYAPLAIQSAGAASKTNKASTASASATCRT